MDVVIGQVMQFGRGSLEVLAQGCSIFEDRIWIDDALLEAEIPLQKGDRVVLVTCDGQNYYLLSRVVRYG